MSKNFDGIKTQRFGVEIECTGLTRAAAAKAVAMVIGGSPEHFGGNYGYDVYDSKNRRWKIMSDTSIRCTNKNGNPASKLYSVELVTPILEYGDMEMLQEVVRSIQRSGVLCNESTGIHIHIDFEPYVVAAISFNTKSSYSLILRSFLSYHYKISIFIITPIKISAPIAVTAE